MPSSFFNHDRMAGEEVALMLSDGRTVTGYAVYTVAVDAAGNPVSSGWSFANYTTSSTFTPLTGVGVLHGVTVNSLGTVASTVEVYDGVDDQGVLIGTIDSLTQSGQFLFDVGVTDGITLVVTGTVAPNITVTYR